jgi:hypothetical protein
MLKIPLAMVLAGKTNIFDRSHGLRIGAIDRLATPTTHATKHRSVHLEI